MPRDYNTVTVGGVVPQRIPVRSNIEAFTNALNKIDARADEVAKQATAIDVALSQADLNEKENAWKAKKSQQIKDELLTNKYDDISSNWRRAQTLAAEVTKELMPRVKYQQEFKKQSEAIAARNDISDLTKERWRAQNQYAYQDQFDNDGNWIGGNDWKANWLPVARKDPKNLIVLAGQLAAPEVKSTSSQTSSSYSDANGIAGAAKSKSGSDLLQRGGSSSKSFGYKKLTKEKLDKVYGALQALDPDSFNSALQDFEDMQWKVKDLQSKLNTETNEGIRTAMQSTIDTYNKEMYSSKDSRMFTPQEWLLNKVGLITGAMSYYNTDISTSSSSSVVYGDSDITKNARANGQQQDLADALGKITLGHSSGSGAGANSETDYLTGGSTNTVEIGQGLRVFDMMK